MALPVPESAAGPRADIIRLLAETPEGLSDGELAAALADRHPDLNAKAVNHQCRKLVASGAVERVGTRPVRTRLLEVPAEPEPGPTEGHATHSDQASELPDVPLDGGESAPAPGLPPVQADIVRVLADAPGGLTDNELAEALGPRYPDADPKSFNYQSRKLAKAGIVERSARSRDAPIRTRLLVAPEPAPAEQRGDPPGTTEGPSSPTGVHSAPEPVAEEPTVEQPAAAEQPGVDEPAVDQPAASSEPPIEEPAVERPAARARTRAPREPAAEEQATEEIAVDEPAEEPEPALVGAPSRRPRRRAKTPSDDVARIRRSERDGDDPDEPLLRFLPFASAATARTALRERMAERAALRRVPERPDVVEIPTRDVLQGWSRTQNVAAAIATWLTRRGAAIREAHGVGPAHDLVATLDGDDVHIEVTGWPPDGARSHPTTLAGDWFHAATRAASQRRRAHPRGRVVVAVPDTRRYRALADDAAEALRRARAEVWFVDSSGVVEVS